MSRRITGIDVVLALKDLGRTVTAKEIAAQLGITDTRAIATAARQPVKDGRITQRHKRRLNAAMYRFVRLKPTSHGAGVSDD